MVNTNRDSLLTPFHLAIRVRDLNEAREFYGNKLGFSEGRSSKHWIDFNCFGHQLVTHLDPDLGNKDRITTIINPVDTEQIPVPHFGVVMELPQWKLFCQRLEGVIDDFIIQPTIRFHGQVGEQAIVFFADPSGNVLEFKAFNNIEQQLFADM